MQDGQWLTLIGPNGSGQSTLLKAIAGGLKPAKARIVVDGVHVTGWEEHRRASLFQFMEQGTDANLVPSMTLEENPLLSLRSRGFPRLRIASRPSRRDKISECLVEFGMGLEQDLRRQLRHLSGGQRAAVAVAKTILQDAKVLLLDEFTASLDPHVAPLLSRTVLSLAEKRQVAVPMVSHHVGEVVDCAKEVVFLNRGRRRAAVRKRTPPCPL